jgi:hypothetical protein
MVEVKPTEILEKLDQLRTELVELAYTLDTRGQLDAADVAMTTSARIGELCAELAVEPQGKLQPVLETAPARDTHPKGVGTLPAGSFSTSAGI